MVTFPVRRVLPCLLLHNRGLVKTKQFKNPVYIGDPINAMRIFSEKEADEVVLLDIEASKRQKEPDFDLISEIAGEAFMPVAYGGGVKRIDQVRRLIRCGIEKVVINSSAFQNPELIKESSRIFGSQAIVGGVDVRRSIFGTYRVFAECGTKEINVDLGRHIANLVELGVGEIFLNNIDRDGMMAGYDLPLIRHISAKLKVPLVVCGGAGSTNDLDEAVESGASGVAAGSMFVYYGKHKAVLINYLTERSRK
jgi:cyclase